MTADQLILRLRDEIQELSYQLPQSQEAIIALELRIIELEQQINAEKPANQ